jgi:hypothetical protein
MDPLWLIEKAYKKTRHHVGGEWQDQFRWCFGGDGGGSGGGGEGEEAGYDIGMSGLDQAASAAAADEAAADAAGFDASAMAANAAAANAAAEAASVAGFAEFGGAQTTGQAEAEQEGLSSAAQDAFDMGVIDEIGLNQLGLELNVEDPAFPTVQTMGPTATVTDLSNFALTGLDISPIQALTAPLGIPFAGVATNKAAEALGAPETMTTGILSQLGVNYDPVGLPDFTNTMSQAELDAEQEAQDAANASMARGGVVRLQNGIGSLYGRK